MTQSDEKSSGLQVLKPGQRVYDEHGREIGLIQSITDIGVEVNTHDKVDTLSLKRTPTTNVAEGYLVWRCTECGELGDVNHVPDRCPSCGSGREELYAYLED